MIPRTPLRSGGGAAGVAASVIARLLLRLPPGQRAAIVLRYWEDLSEAEAAQVLGCSPGTVKSAASRGLARLRELGGTPPAAPACQEGTMQR